MARIMRLEETAGQEPEPEPVPQKLPVQPTAPEPFKQPKVVEHDVGEDVMVRR